MVQAPSSELVGIMELGGKRKHETCHCTPYSDHNCYHLVNCARLIPEQAPGSSEPRRRCPGHPCRLSLAHSLHIALMEKESFLRHSSAL